MKTYLVTIGDNSGGYFTEIEVEAKDEASAADKASAIVEADPQALEWQAFDLELDTGQHAILSVEKCRE